ncbi:uncharacterized protein LOC124369597 isoform X3 [Homalodisca vitripennis]|uniref:uncharacterized protein LOC124369597 isoform X3 n=1 Tax=Homalodisca vitripennis TaxID=197043 RepID=UPI001EEA7C58|nr:uncharacterized protein LOC124369597 isoform X3 [Homalodisca vitripennis]
MGERSQVPCIVIEDDDDVILVEDENEKPSSSTYSGGMPRPKKTDYELEMDLLQTLLDTGERVPIKYKLFFASKAERRFHTRHGQHFNDAGKEWLVKLIVEATAGRKMQSQQPHLTDEQPPPPDTETPSGNSNSMFLG